MKTAQSEEMRGSITMGTSRLTRDTPHTGIIRLYYYDPSNDRPSGGLAGAFGKGASREREAL
jgi:hypothetical protein